MSFAVLDEASPGNTLPWGFHPCPHSITSLSILQTHYQQVTGEKSEKKSTHFLLFVCIVRAGCKLMNTRSEQPWGGFPGNKGNKARGAHLLPDGIWDTPTPSDFPRATHTDGVRLLVWVTIKSI